MAHRIRRSILASGWLLAAGGALGLFLTTPAFAGHRDGDRYERRHDRHDRYERRHNRHARVERRHDRHERRRHRRANHRGYERHNRGPRVHVHGDSCGYRNSHARSESYYCEPCGHRFHSRSRFHDHLHGHHRIPIWKLPFVIVHSTLGWIFHG